MSRYGRDPEEIKLDIAYAVGNDLDILEYLGSHHERRSQ